MFFENNTIFIRHNGRYLRLSLAEIDYIEANRNYTTVVAGETKYSCVYKMLEWEAVLPPSFFCRIHRGYIVSLHKMYAFDQHKVFLPDLQLPIGEAYRGRLEQTVTLVSPAAMRERRSMFQSILQ